MCVECFSKTGFHMFFLPDLLKAVEGELGASYTVYATNWKCGECKGDNYPSAAFRIQRAASAKSRETPSPFKYMIPRLY